MAEVKNVSETKKAVARPQATRALSPFEEMDRLFDSFFSAGGLRPLRWDWPGWPRVEAELNERMPKIDVLDRDDEIVVRAELPGVDKDNLDISLSEDTLTIKATTRHESSEDEGDYHRREISTGSFARSIALPAAVDGDKAKASLKDGLLELTLPKAAPARRHSIKVES